MDSIGLHAGDGESFGSIFEGFHAEDPSSWDRMKMEKRESRQPRRNRDLIDFLIEHDISIIRDILEYVVERRKRRYAHDMAYLDSESSNIPPEIKIAVMTLLEDHSFYSLVEIEFRLQDENLKGQPLIKFDEKMLQRIRENLVKERKAKPKVMLLPEPPLYRGARQSMRKSLSHAMTIVKKYQRAKKKVEEGPPNGLFMVDGGVDLNNFMEVMAQLDGISPLIGGDIEYPPGVHILIGAYMSPSIGFVLLRSREFVDFIICLESGKGNHENMIGMMVRKNRISVEKCIEFLQKLDIHRTRDIILVQEYLHSLLLILSFHD